MLHPHLLLLTWAFPPSRAIGALRPWYLAKHLVRLGWRVTVVTPDPELLSNPDPEVNIESWCRAAGVERRLTGHGWRVLLGGWLRLRGWERSRLLGGAVRKVAGALMIDQEVGWHGPMLQSCAGFRPGEVDLVLGTGPPFCVFNLSARVAARLHAPFVLDYRDLWTLSPHLHCEPPPRDFRREQASLHQASGVVVVSEPMADCLQRRFNLPARPCIVTNGFDSDDFRDLQPKEFDDFAVVYAGNFYPPKRVIDPVIGAIRLANEGAAAGQRAIRLHYYGRDAGHVQEAAQAQRATECVVIHGFVPRQEVLAAMKGAGAAAVITSVESKASAADDSILTGKLFEAIGTGAPILLVAPTGTEAARVVERPGAGRAFSGSQIQPMADWLRKLAHGKSPVAARELSEYSWPQLALQADAFLRQLLAEPKNSESIPRTRGG